MQAIGNPEAVRSQALPDPQARAEAQLGLCQVAPRASRHAEVVEARRHGKAARGELAPQLESEREISFCLLEIALDVCVSSAQGQCVGQCQAARLILLPQLERPIQIILGLLRAGTLAAGTSKAVQDVREINGPQ